jgi:hypothetical protein
LESNNTYSRSIALSTDVPHKQRYDMNLDSSASRPTSNGAVTVRFRELFMMDYTFVWSGIELRVGIHFISVSACRRHATTY